MTDDEMPEDLLESIRTTLDLSMGRHYDGDLAESVILCAQEAYDRGRLSTTALARGLFDTSPEVVSWLDRVAEYPGAWDERWESRRNRVRDEAWERDENGWRTDATRRASAILDSVRARGEGGGE